MTPAIVAVASDADLRQRLGEVLRRRYEPDYAVTVAADPAVAIAPLEALSEDAGGQEVAMMLIPLRIDGAGADGEGDADGISFLVRTRRLHPGAQRVLVIDVGDVSAAPRLSQALTLNQVDAYFGQPWASPEEEVYPLLGEVLRTWALSHQPRYEKVAVVDEPGRSRGPVLVAWLNRNNVTATLVPADGDRGRSLLAEHRLEADRLPVAVLHDGGVLIEPREVELAEALRARTRPAREQ